MCTWVISHHEMWLFCGLIFRRHWVWGKRRNYTNYTCNLWGHAPQGPQGFLGDVDTDFHSCTLLDVGAELVMPSACSHHSTKRNQTHQKENGEENSELVKYWCHSGEIDSYNKLIQCSFLMLSQLSVFFPFHIDSHLQGLVHRERLWTPNQARYSSLKG